MKSLSKQMFWKLCIRFLDPISQRIVQLVLLFVFQWLSEDCKTRLRERLDSNENLPDTPDAPELNNIPSRPSCDAVTTDSTLEGSSNCPFTHTVVEDTRFFPYSFMYAVCCHGGCVENLTSSNHRHRYHRNQPSCQPLLSTKTVLLQNGSAHNCEQDHFEERKIQLPFACVCAMEFSSWSMIHSALEMWLDMQKKPFIFTKFVPNLNWRVSVISCQTLSLKSLALGRGDCNLKLAIFKLISRKDSLSISCEISLMWMAQDLVDDWSTLVQVYGLLPDAIKPLPEAISAKLYDALCHH